MSTNDWDTDGTNGDSETLTEDEIRLKGPMRSILKKSDTIRKHPVRLATSSIKGGFQLFGKAKLQFFGFGIALIVVNAITSSLGTFVTGGLGAILLPIILPLISLILFAGLYEAAFGLVKKDGINMQDFMEGTKHVLSIYFVGFLQGIFTSILTFPIWLMMTLFPLSIPFGIGLFIIVGLGIFLPVYSLAMLLTVRENCSGLESIKKGFQLFAEYPLAFTVLNFLMFFVIILVSLTIVGLLVVVPISILIYVAAIEIMRFPVQEKEDEW